MRLILFTIIIIFSIASNAQTDYYECPVAKKNEFVENASLKPRSIPDTGRNIVFKFQQDYDCPDIFDDEFSTRLVWEVPANSNSFELTFNKKDSLIAPISYYVVTANLLRFKLKSANGHISGKLNGNVWKIHGQLELDLLNLSNNIEGKRMLDIDGNFVKYNVKIKKDYHRLYKFIN